MKNAKLLRITIFPYKFNKKDLEFSILYNTYYDILYIENNEIFLFCDKAKICYNYIYDFISNLVFQGIDTYTIEAEIHFSLIGEFYGVFFKTLYSISNYESLPQNIMITDDIGISAIDFIHEEILPFFITYENRQDRTIYFINENILNNTTSLNIEIDDYSFAIDKIMLQNITIKNSLFYSKFTTNEKYTEVMLNFGSEVKMFLKDKTNKEILSLSKIKQNLVLANTDYNIN